MNKTLSNLLILGGVDHIFSYIPKPEIFDSIWLVLFILLFIIIVCKKNFSLFTALQNKFTKITHYIEALGIMDYFSFLFGTVAGFIFGYLSALRQYNNESPLTEIAFIYFSYLTYTYFILLAIVLIWATYISFFQKKDNN